ncbi:angiopoietin-4 isoform X1 [Heliangelus exortis]|uniref:angiopoietin-4 isoform X1 n=1 Tax=Heliangelus exortis TaxID=472823 RepID=UPI003A8FD1C6
MRALSLGLVALTCVTAVLGVGHRRSHRVQHGHCSYTFVLPEAEPPPCPLAPLAPGPANALFQRDSPAAGTGHSGATQRLRHLERILENSTQWLLKLESYIQTGVKPEMAELRQTAVQNQTATMLEISSSLLNQSAEQSRKLTDVEAQVLNQTLRLEMQLQENSLSTTKLEKQLLLQTNEIHKLQNRNNILETRVLEMETKHEVELAGARLEKEKLQRLLSRQSGSIQELEKSLVTASTNASLLQRQQLQLLESVQSLVRLVSQGRGLGWWHRNRLTQPQGDDVEERAITRGHKSIQRERGRATPPRQGCGTGGLCHLTIPSATAPLPRQEQLFQDCAEVRLAGIRASGVYTLHIANLSEPKKAYCDMETDRGGWTVIQLRTNGSLSFQRGWKEYKQGFGDAAGEYWLGNEAVHLLTSQAPYTLRVELRDWEGGQVYAHYGKFQLGSERQLYRLSLQNYSGTAGQQSGLALQGTRFSTRDADNDNCLCKCAQMLSGGWWFDACGLSNLNGIYYPARHNIRKLNGIRWHRLQGPSYSLQGTRMLIRPASF